MYVSKNFFFAIFARNKSLKNYAFIEHHFRPMSTTMAEKLSNRVSIYSAKNRVFDEEKRRQQSLIPRVKKIEVVVKSIKPEQEVVLMMNAHLSTPFNCAQHIHELYTQRSVVAQMDDNTLWDLHRPLVDSCSFSFRHFKEEDCGEVNKVFWRSCSFLLGMVIEKSFKDDVPVILHSWPKPNVKTGSFVYDVELPSLSNWCPTESELRTLTAMFWKIRQAKYRFERLDVSPAVAKEIFADNNNKLQQLNSLKTDENTTISLYRVNDHIDYSVGPMIPDTSYVGRVSVTSVHQITVGDRKLYRIQGVAIPSQLRLNFFAFNVLMNRSKKLNQSSFPSQ